MFILFKQYFDILISFESELDVAYMSLNVNLYINIYFIFLYTFFGRFPLHESSNYSAVTEEKIENIKNGLFVKKIIT